MKNRDIYWRRYKTQETLYMGQWCPFKVGIWGPHTVLPIVINCATTFSWISDGLKSPPFQRWFSEVAECQIWATEGLSHPGNLMFHQKTPHQRWCMSRCIVVMKLPFTSCHSCGLLNYLNSFCRGTFKLNTKFVADSLLYSLCHFECDGHAVHMLNKNHLPPPLTSSVRSSLFTHAYSSPVSLAARLHQCCLHLSHCINNGWTFPGQTSYILFKRWKKLGPALKECKSV